MADRHFYPHGGSAVPAVVTLFAKITAAADVEANGYAITKGSDFVSSVTRTDEGDARIALKDSYNRLVGLSYVTSRSDSKMIFAAEDVDGLIPYVDVTFEEAGSPTDPDSAIIFLRLDLANMSE